MGIRGLSTFFNYNPNLTDPYKLHNTRVVIDGCNLECVLQDGPTIYGGDYNRYAADVKKYFSIYAQCKIKPIVLMDGGMDKSDRKLKTLLQRMESSLEIIDCFAKSEPCSSHIIQRFFTKVFIDVINEMNIEHVQCSYEADGAICKIANYYRCPVISLDSDFYIFNIGYGFIRTDNIDLTVRVGINQRGQEYCYLSCKIYYVDKLLSFFPGIKKSVLPLFSTLLGNDFVDSSIFDKFFLGDDFPTVRSIPLNVAKRHQRMMGLLEWLRLCRDVDDAVERVLQYLPTTERESVKALMEQSMNVYKVFLSDFTVRSESLLTGYTLCVISSEEELTSFKGAPVPDWFTEDFHNNCLCSGFINIIGLRREMLPIQYQDTALPSIHICSLPIRQVLYGLLLSIDSASEHDTEEKCIEEYDRLQGTNTLKSELIKPAMHIEGFGPLPKLSELRKLKVIDAKRLICCTLAEDSTYLHDLPEDLQLIVMCIRYWLKNSSPKPFANYLDALLINILYLAVAKPRVKKNPKALDHSHLTCTKLSPDSGERASIFDLIKYVSESDAIYFCRNMPEYLEIPKWNGTNHSTILSFVHSFSQFQSCLHYIMYLNDLFGKPFTRPKIHCIYSGYLIFDMATVLQSQNSPKLFRPSSALDFLFKKLRSKVLENLPETCIQKLETTGSSTGRRRRKNNRRRKGKK